MIVEVSQGAGDDDARSAIAELLDVTDIKHQCRKFTEPARIEVTGYGFYDGHHACAPHPHVGCKHGSDHVGTLWELHPVWKVTLKSKGKKHAC